MLVRMSASALARLSLFALGSALAVALRWVLSNVLGGFASDWISGLLGSTVGVEEKQVIEALTPWVLPALIASLAMWAAYSYGARYAGSTKASAPLPTPAPVLGATTAASADMKGFTNPKLADQVQAFTKRLRNFELIENGATDVEEAKIDIMHAKISSLGKMLKGDPASREAIEGEIARLETRANDLEKARAHRRLSEFQAQFLQEAIQLRAELSRRTGRPLHGADDPATDLLDKGKFELKSLKALISYLHEMSDRLPD